MVSSPPGQAGARLRSLAEYFCSLFQPLQTLRTSIHRFVRTCNSVQVDRCDMPKTSSSLLSPMRRILTSAVAAAEKAKPFGRGTSARRTTRRTSTDRLLFRHASFLACAWHSCSSTGFPVARVRAGTRSPSGSSCLSFGIGAGRQGRSGFAVSCLALSLFARSSRPLPPNISVKWTAAMCRGNLTTALWQRPLTSSVRLHESE